MNQLKARHIGAGNQKYQAYRGEQHEQHGSELTDQHGGELRYREELIQPFVLPLWSAVPALLLVANSGHELLHPKTGLHSPNHVPDHLAAIADEFRRDGLWRVDLRAARVVEPR